MSLVAFETVLSCVMVVLAGISCGPEGIRLSSPTGTPALGGEEPRSQLEEALSLVPLEFADSPVEFADYSSYLELRGRGEVPWPYEGMRLHRDLKSHVVTLDELLGLDVLSSDFGIWTWEPGNTSPKFYASRGGFEGETVARGLLEIGYEERDYYGNLYYALGDDFAWSIQHPLGATGVSLNRVAVIGAWLLAAPSTGILARLIDLHKWGQQPSLLDSEPHRALLDAVGLRAVGGAFFSPEWVAENWNTVNTGPVERLDRYLTGPGQWGQLSAYTLAFMGYRIRGDADETVVALYYPEPGAAALGRPRVGTPLEQLPLQRLWRWLDQRARTRGRAVDPLLRPVFRYSAPETRLFRFGGNLPGNQERRIRSCDKRARPVDMVVREQGTRIPRQ